MTTKEALELLKPWHSALIVGLSQLIAVPSGYKIDPADEIIYKEMAMNIEAMNIAIKTIEKQIALEKEN